MKIDFETSILKTVISSINCLLKLNLHKENCKNAIDFWNKEKANKVQFSDENIIFFSAALKLCESKIKKLEYVVD